MYIMHGLIIKLIIPMHNMLVLNEVHLRNNCIKYGYQMDRVITATRLMV